MASTKVAGRAQVAIAGAGVGGLALAGLLGRAGVSVLLIDRAPAPRDKVCGEGIMPLGVGVLRRLGIDPAALPGHDFHGLDFHTRRQTAAVPFEPGRHGRGIRRTRLIEALEATALTQPGVTLVRDVLGGPEVAADGPAGARVTGFRGRAGIYRGEVFVAADGVRSGMLAALGVPLQGRGYRMGIRQHFALERPLVMPRVRVGLFPPYDVYLTSVGERELLATTMCDGAAFRRISGDYAGFLRETPFGATFAGGRPVSRRLGWHHPLFRPRRFVAGGMLAVGDAGGGIDPCLGMGMSFALASAEAAAEAIGAMLRDPDERPAAERRFESWRQGLFRRYALFDSIFRFLITSQAGSETLVWGMRHWPDTAAAITGIVAQCRPWRDFAWTSLLRPRLG